MKLTARIFATFFGIILSQQASAAAFAVKEQSVTYLGNAFAGTASSSLDASSGYYNPAGLGELKNNQLVAAVTYVEASLQLYNAVGRTQGGAVATGGSRAKPKSRALVPGAFFSWRLNNKTVFGLGVAAPFGLSTKYSNTDVARYMATESKITTVDTIPSVSYMINDKFSVGVAFDAMYVKATLASATNFGAGNGFLSNKADGWTFGYHLGILYKPSASTKMGLAYFSRFTPRVSGTATSANLPFTAPSTLTAQVNLPDRIVYSITHEYSEAWRAMGEIEWTHWSRLKSLRLNYNTGRTSTEVFNYLNAFRFSLGTDYHYKQNWVFKGGLAFEQTPVTNTYRSARLPDGDRYWLALGAKYTVNKNISFDAAYAHLFVKNVPIAQRGAASSTLFGNYRSSADIVGIQLTWNFV